MKRTLLITFIALLCFAFSNQIFAQKKKGKKGGEKEKTEQKEKSLFNPATFSAFKMRNIGPAFMSGRIADIAIHPEDDNVWYVAVGSGGVWKTNNAGVTWKPIFDKQKSYSIGCVTIDPNNPHTVWVGTGENVGGRHVGYGDGIYRSDDDGASWQNMGLKESHHLSKIIVHPENSDVVWVAAQGPLWSKGDERGLYKTTDGGKNWKKVLGDDEWVGVTEVVIDPRDPDWLYAATWQRHRNVANYMGGGPGTGLHRSKNGGETWEKLSTGLPKSNKGKIGLAISPQKPDVLYAAIELDRTSGGVYRSDNRGASWKKQSNAVSGATGPHYYQELYACPHNFDRIYLMDVRIQVSDDGGKTFRRLNEQQKHSDNHSLTFRKDDPDYLLVGTDGGVYESFDLAQNWRYISNLPLTQFYKVALDDSEPFYNIYGGTQDNSTQCGPSRTDNSMGIRNSDWEVVLGGDGHQPATEPGNPAVVYAESQQGVLSRLDRITGERVSIQPQPEAGEDYERLNWDSPILVSPHSPSRIYFASQRVWRSDDRGDSWTPISGDLTLDQERFSLPIMDKTWGWDAAWDVNAMSTYNTITSLAESPLQEGLIYAGTDDGLVQVTEDGGANWRKIEVGSMPGVPATAFVNDIKVDLFDVNTVYVVLDNHKFGDLNPYLLKSTDRGLSWTSMKGDVPDRTLLWRIVQDHEKANLFFLASEFGIYFTVDGGKKWIMLRGGVPTISFRDLAIHRRENDLVGASFGRGFFVLDDYSPLRGVSEAQLKEEASLFPTRKAWWYLPRSTGGGSQGAGFYTTPNPPFGAVFTYYLAESPKSKKELRKEKVRALIKENKDVPFLNWDELEEERKQSQPTMWLTVKDSDGKVVRRLKGPARKGFHRIAWNLRYASSNPVSLSQRPASGRSFRGGSSGMIATPGTYNVTLSKEVDGVITELSEPMPFEVERMHKKSALKGATPKEILAFSEKVSHLSAASRATSTTLNRTMSKINAMQTALSRSAAVPGELDSKLHQLKRDLMDLDAQLNGNRSRREVGEKTNPTINNRLRVAGSAMNSTYGPTKTQMRNLEIGQELFKEVKAKLEMIVNKRVPVLEKALQEAGAPWIEGQAIPDID